MKPTIQIAATTAPDGTPVVLYEHDGDYTIHAGRQVLMSSREHESERELARIGCARIASHRAPRLLIGGLGLGYTLRQALDLLSPKAQIVVAEMLPAVVRWNRDHVGHLCGHPLRDPRVTVHTRDVQEVMKQETEAFDAILLDIDNGPEAFTHDGNGRLYTPAGLRVCLDALHARGCLALWSGGGGDSRFVNRLRSMKMHVRCFPAAASASSKRFSRRIWLASRDLRSLPETPSGKRGD